MSEPAMVPVGSWALVLSADPMLLEQARRGIESVGVHCETVTTVDAALTCLEGGRRDYAVVFVDNEVPELPVEDVVTIAAVTSPAAVIVRCGVGASRTRAAGRLWIDKPCVASDFVRVVAKLRTGATSS